MTRTVLIVDDHAGFRASARRLLESEGYDVVGEAADGAQALAEVSKLRPDIVLLDIQLPDIDGFEVAERLVAEAGNGNAPEIVLVSSRDPSDFGALLDSSPACGCLGKGELSGARIAEALAR